MLAGGTDLGYRQALCASHEPIVRVEIWRAGSLLLPDMVINNGNVTATLTSRVSRIASVLSPGYLYDVVSPFSDVMRAYRGLRLGDGTPVEWEVFRGRVGATGLTEDGQLEFESEDLAGAVIANGFTVPENSTVGANVRDEMYRIIADRLPGALFGVSDEYTQRVPAMTWEHDPGQALDEMGTAIGSFWYPLANGRFVVRRVPWTVNIPPVLTLEDGEGGFLLSSAARKDRSRVFNQVTVTGERLDGSAPVYYTASDTDPTSPTYIYGPFGIQNRLINLNTPDNVDAARGAAFDYLRRSTALTESWSFTCPVDGSMELGDVFTLKAQGHIAMRQVVTTIGIPLIAAGAMSVQCRAQVIGELADA